MLILILIDVQYLQNIVFNFQKSSNGQNHYTSVFHHPIKKNRKISYSPNLEVFPHPLENPVIKKGSLHYESYFYEHL